MKPKIIYSIFQSIDKANETDFMYFEKHFRKSFPTSYKDFLYEKNGGTPKPQSFKSKFLLKNLFYVSSFLSTEYLKLEIIDSDLPEGYIQVAYDGGGNSYCISLLESDYGKVYFWDHEKSEDECLTLLADNFDEFINGFEEEDDD